MANINDSEIKKIIAKDTGIQSLSSELVVAVSDRIYFNELNLRTLR